MNHSRPVNLDLSTLKFPPMAIASILHRVSGVILFLLLPFMLYLLSLSLQSNISFDRLQTLLTSPYLKLVIWVFLSALVYHIIAGLRHLVMDFGFGEGIESGRRSAVIVIALGVVLAIGLGVWVW